MLFVWFCFLFDFDEFNIGSTRLFMEFMCMFLQGVMSSAPDIIGNTLHADHDHGSGGHPHGIDLEHPVLALSMTTLAISVKEG